MKRSGVMESHATTEERVASVSRCNRPLLRLHCPRASVCFGLQSHTVGCFENPFFSWYSIRANWPPINKLYHRTLKKLKKKRERERDGENSNTLFYKDCSLGLVKYLTTTKERRERIILHYSPPYSELFPLTFSLLKLIVWNIRENIVTLSNKAAQTWKFVNCLYCTNTQCNSKCVTVVTWLH